MYQPHFGHLSAIDVARMQLALRNTKINGIPSKTKNVFLDQNFQSEPRYPALLQRQQTYFTDQFQIQFQKERESLESFDLADWENKCSAVSIFPSILPYDLRPSEREPRKEREPSQLNLIELA